MCRLDPGSLLPQTHVIFRCLGGDPTPPTTTSHAKPTGTTSRPPSQFHLSPPPASLFEASRRALDDHRRILANTKPSPSRDAEGVDPVGLEEMRKREERARADSEHWNMVIDRRIEERKRHERELDGTASSDESSGLEYIDEPPREAPFSNSTSSNTAATKNAPPVQQSSDTRRDHQQPPQRSDDREGKEPPAKIVIPWGDDTVQDEEMLRYGLVVYLPFKILICIACQTVIDPKYIFSHVHKDQPRAGVTKAYCLELAQRFSLTPKHQLNPPSTLTKAIPCLELKEGYVYCTGCNRAMEHDRSLKSTHTCSGFEIKKGFAQAFFPRAHQGGYFAVTVPPRRPDVQPMDLVQILKDTFPDPNPADRVITLPKNPPEGNHFLEMQGWVQTLNGLTGAQIQYAVREVNTDLRLLVSRSIAKYMSKVDSDLVGTRHSMRVAMASYNELVFRSHFPLLEITDANGQGTPDDRYVRLPPTTELSAGIQKLRHRPRHFRHWRLPGQIGHDPREYHERTEGARPAVP